MAREDIAIRAGYQQMTLKSTLETVNVLSDTADLTINGRPIFCKAVYVGVAGHLKFLPPGNADNEPVTYYNLPAGSKPVFAARRIYSTGTTADELVMDFDEQDQ